MAVAADGFENLYVADTLNNCIRKIDADGNVTTVAGNTLADGFQDGPAAEAVFSAPAGIAVSDGGAVYISDTGNHRIRKLEGGNVSTVAGNAAGFDEDGAPLGGFRDGQGENALFNLPRGLAFADGVLYVADSANNRIRTVDAASGSVYTLAGNGEPGDTDGRALEAKLHQPMGVHFDGGKLYIADTGNNKIKAMELGLEE